MCENELECDCDQVPSLSSTSAGTIEPFADWKKARISANVYDMKQFTRCSSGTYLRWTGLPFLDVDPIHVKANCAHNVYLSLHKRYLKNTPEVQRGKLNFKLLNRIISYLISQIKERIEPFNAQEWFKEKPGRLRRRYHDAYSRMIKDGVDLNKISDISAFVKLERYFEDGKAPRMIMGRNPAFTLLYSQVVCPIEKAFFKLDQCANACDYISCGEKFSKLVGDWFVENDMSKYEASQRLFTLAMEYTVYRGVYPDTAVLDQLFTTKYYKKGHTTTGVNFSFEGCRGSGDADTSLGNGILNYISTMYFLIINTCTADCKIDNCGDGCKAKQFVLKGDDSYMSYPRRETFENTYMYFGFEAKLIIRRTPAEVEFCSGHFIEHRPGEYVYVQKLRKLLQSLTTCINPDAIKNGWVGQYYKSLGLMYSKIYAGIPVYEDIGKFLMSVDCKHGLRVELIQSYNLISAFKNFSNGIGSVNRELAAVSVSMVNDMDFAELSGLQTFLKTHTIHIPPALNKRMNTVKTRDAIDMSINWELLNVQFTGRRYSRQEYKILLQLRKFACHTLGE